METAAKELWEKQDEIKKLIRSCGEIILKNTPFTSVIHHKEGAANFVTDFDVEIQKILIASLTEMFPGCGFFGEENTDNNDRRSKQGLCFFIDPIDGTTNYICRYNFSCVSVGAAYDGTMIAGFVFNPYVNEMFSAIRGYGSFLNGSRLIIQNNLLENSIVSFGCARYNEGDTDILFRTVKELYQRCLAIRSGGSAALDICRIATGANGIYIEMTLQPYDYAAGAVILEEAGGCIAQIDGSDISLHEQCSILAGTPKAVVEVREILIKLQNNCE